MWVEECQRRENINPVNNKMSSHGQWVRNNTCSIIMVMEKNYSKGNLKQRTKETKKSSDF